MNLLNNDDLKEQQKIRDLELSITKQRDKLDKKLTRQKILLGAFLLDTLEKNEVHGLKEYTAKALPEYLTRDTDKELLKGLVENLGGNMPPVEDEVLNENTEDAQIEEYTNRRY